MLGEGFRMIGKNYQYKWSGMPDDTWSQGFKDTFPFGFFLKVIS